MIKKHLLVGLAAFGIAAVVTVPSYALSNTTSDHHREEHSSDAESRRITSQSSQADRQTERQDSLQNKREQLRNRVQALKEQRSKKLEGKREQICEKREDKINTLLEKSANNAERRYEFINKVKERLKNFYETKALSSDDYASVVAQVAEKESEARAALDVMKAQEFSCDEVNGDKPGQVIREVVQARVAAMKAYKQTVRELLVVTREAYSENRNSKNERVRLEESQ